MSFYYHSCTPDYIYYSLSAYSRALVNKGSSTCVDTLKEERRFPLPKTERIVPDPVASFFHGDRFKDFIL